jgi:hypothetical protein
MVGLTVLPTKQPFVTRSPLCDSYLSLQPHTGGVLDDINVERSSGEQRGCKCSYELERQKHPTSEYDL